MGSVAASRRYCTSTSRAFIVLIFCISILPHLLPRSAAVAAASSSYGESAQAEELQVSQSLEPISRSICVSNHVVDVFQVGDEVKLSHDFQQYGTAAGSCRCSLLLLLLLLLLLAAGNDGCGSGEGGVCHNLV